MSGRVREHSEQSDDEETHEVDADLLKYAEQTDKVADLLLASVEEGTKMQLAQMVNMTCKKSRRAKGR